MGFPPTPTCRRSWLCWAASFGITAQHVTCSGLGGIRYCCWGCKDTVSRSTTPWRSYPALLDTEIREFVSLGTNQNFHQISTSIVRSCQQRLFRNLCCLSPSKLLRKWCWCRGQTKQSSVIRDWCSYRDIVECQRKHQGQKSRK
jgi:hypothetical protein